VRLQRLREHSVVTLRYFVATAAPWLNNRVLRFEPMRLLSRSLLGVLLASGFGLVSLVGCDLGGNTSPDAAAGKPSAGSPNSGGAGSATGGGGNTSGNTSQGGSTGGKAGSSAGGAGGANGGGSAGAASGGGGSSGGSAGGANGCQGALICDDFEGYDGTPGDPWKVTKNAAGNVVIDGAQHKSGTKAVKLTTTGAMSYQQAFISLEKIFPIANNALYGRMMIYATSIPSGDSVHWTLIEGEGKNTAEGIDNAQVRYGGQQAKSLMANYDSTGKKSDCWMHSSTKMPEAKWVCMEWYFDGATNTQKFWLDGKAIDDLTVTGQGQGCISQDTGGKWLYPSFSRLNLGWTSYQTDEPREVWIDDVAVGAAQIGCPQ
jgi:hypothetical protein